LGQLFDIVEQLSPTAQEPPNHLRLGQETFECTTSTPSYS
jgi:hypothetical protein